jgi:peptidase M23-like protein
MTPRRIPLLFALASALALTAPVEAGAAGDWTWPVRGRVITPYRNGDDPYAAGQHRGIDIAAPVGRPVVAATAGVVTFAGTAGSSGRSVTVRTADGRFDTTYLHLSSISARVGDRLGRGARLGAVGTTGRRSSPQPHLHFGVRQAGSRHVYRDPLYFLPAPPTAGSAPPRGAMAPVGAPRPLAPRPPHVVPMPSRGPAPRPAPDRHPAVAQSAPPARAALPAGAVGAPRHRGSPVPRAAPGAHDAAARAAAAAPGAAPEARRLASPRRAGRHARPAGGGGFDAGLVAAGVGLLIAAALLGRRRVADGEGTPGPRGVAALVRPLLGRG